MYVKPFNSSLWLKIRERGRIHTQHKVTQSQNHCSNTCTILLASPRLQLLCDAAMFPADITKTVSLVISIFPSTQCLAKYEIQWIACIPPFHSCKRVGFFFLSAVIVLWACPFFCLTKLFLSSWCFGSLTGGGLFIYWRFYPISRFLMHYQLQQNVFRCIVTCIISFGICISSGVELFLHWCIRKDMVHASY